MDTTFNFWYDETLALAARIGVDENVPRKTFLQRNRSNVPSANPKEHYKRAIAIPLLDSFICQLKDRFEKDNVRSCELLCLITSVFLDSNSSIELQNHLDELLYWSQDLLSLKNLDDGKVFGRIKVVAMIQVFQATSYNL